MLSFKFTTVTPLHISNGEELGINIDYIISDKKLLKLNHIKLAQFLSKKNAFDFSKSYDFKLIEGIIKRYSTEIYDSESSYIVDIDSKVTDYLKRPNVQGKHFVKEFINSNGKFYIPASSVKGALLTVLGLEKLGIDNNGGNINQKFVVMDSDFISDNNFIVYKTEPGRPSVNIMCLKREKEFTIQVNKKGDLNIQTLKSNLKGYNKKQINAALTNVERYKSRIRNRQNGADYFVEALNNILSHKLADDEFLINLGFGGGSWFKIFSNVPPPTFNNRKTRSQEIAHTVFTISNTDSYQQLGWCKLKIEETL